MDRGVKNAIITLGDNGAFYANEHDSGHVLASEVEGVDAMSAVYVVYPCR